MGDKIIAINLVFSFIVIKLIVQLVSFGMAMAPQQTSLDFLHI